MANKLRHLKKLTACLLSMALIWASFPWSSFAQNGVAVEARPAGNMATGGNFAFQANTAINQWLGQFPTTAGNLLPTLQNIRQAYIREENASARVATASVLWLISKRDTTDFKRLSKEGFEEESIKQLSAAASMLRQARASNPELDKVLTEMGQEVEEHFLVTHPATSKLKKAELSLSIKEAIRRFSENSSLAALNERPDAAVEAVLASNDSVNGTAPPDVPKSIINLKPYAQLLQGNGHGVSLPAVEALPGKNSSTAASTPSDKINVAFKGGLLSRIVAFGHYRSLSKSIKRIVNKLAIEGDNPNYTVNLSANPTPNAMIDPEKSDMTILAGLYAFVGNEDELASVIAHEMTHANKQQMKAQSDSAESDKVLNSLSGYKDLDPAQREELRADLGAVDRMIRAGYNPWGAYDFQKRITRWTAKNWDAQLIKAIFRVFFKRSFDYLEAHPVGEIRMAAMKAYILDRGFKEDLSDLTKQHKKYSFSIGFFRQRARLMALPLTSIWVQRALYLSMFYRFGSWIYGLIFGKDLSATTSLMVDKAGLTPILDAVVHVLKLVWSPFGWVFGKIWDVLSWPFQFVHLPSPPEAVSSTVSHAFPILLLGFFLGMQVLMVYNVILRSNQEAYQNLTFLNSQSKKIQPLLSALASKNKLNSNMILRLLKLNQSSLERAEKLYLNASGIRMLRRTDGLASSKNRSLRIHEELLTNLAALLENTSEQERGKIFAEVDPLIARLPGYAIEAAEMRNALKRVTTLRPENLPQARTSRFLELYDKSQVVTKDTPPAQILSLIKELNDAGLRDTATALFKAHYYRIFRYIFSKENDNPELAKDLASVHASLRNNTSLIPVGLSSRVMWDTRLILAYILSLGLGRGYVDSWGVVSLSSEVPLPRLKWISRRYWLEIVQHRLIRRTLSRSIMSMTEFKTFVERELKPRNVILDNLTDDFFQVILDHPEWIRSQADLDALLAGDYFWPKFGGRANDHGQLEGLFMGSLRQLSVQFPELWKYEPSASEKLHALYISRMKELGVAPKDDAGNYTLWQSLTVRGITSVTDDLFTGLYSKSSGDFRDTLEAQAVDEGRIWEQELKAKIVDRRVKTSQAYHDLLKARVGSNRQMLIRSVIAQIQKGLPERGLYYMNLLEELSRTIRSTEEESRLIQGAKFSTGGEREQDLSLRVMSDVMDRALRWRKKNQWRLVQFLRGDIEATPKIQRAFKTIGPERVRRMFQILPSLTRAGLLDAFLDSPKGLLKKVTPGRGYSKTIINHVLPDDKPQAKEVALEVLEAFLYSLKKTGNGALQSYVMSYLLSRLKNQQGSVGETLKEILELFGATGVKIGQFLAAAQILPESETKALRSLQEQAKIPEREQIYSDLRDITGNVKLPVQVEDLLGAASIKYAILARENESKDPVVLKIFRLDALAHTRAEFNQIEFMADYLVERHGSKYGVFRSIVKASRKAVERELHADHEVAMGEIARQKVYAKQSNESVTVEPPHEILLGRRLIASQFAAGTSIYGLPTEAREEAARSILAIEAANLFADKDTIYFDPDRHPGNYRIRADDLDRVKITPIDFGQMLQITRQQREQVFDMFALAQILKETGSSLWAAERLKTLLGLDATKSSKLRSAISRYFPSRDVTPVSAYYSLLAALDNAGIDMDIVYFDFVRGIIQLSQYEELVPDLKEMSPKAKLEAIVTERAAGLVREMKLTSLEKLNIVLWRVTSRITQLPHVEDAWRNMSRFFSQTFVKAAILLAIIGFSGHHIYQYPSVNQPVRAAVHSVAQMLKTDYEKRLSGRGEYFLTDVLMSSKNLEERDAAAKLLKARVTQGTVESYEVINVLLRTSLRSGDKAFRLHAGHDVIKLIEPNTRWEGILPDGYARALIVLMHDHSEAEVRYGAAAKLKGLVDLGYIKPDVVFSEIDRAAQSDVDGNNQNRFKLLTDGERETRRSYEQQRKERIETLQETFLSSPSPAEQRGAAGALMRMVHSEEIDKSAMVDMYIKVLRNRSERDSERIYNVLENVRGNAWDLRPASTRLVGVVRELMDRSHSRDIRLEAARSIASMAKDVNAVV